MEEAQPFRLIAFLAQDLAAALHMTAGPEERRKGWRLWKGLFSPRFLPVLNCRLAYFFYIRRLGPIAKLFSTLNFFLYGLEIAVRCPIGPGFYLPHTHGTVIGALRIGAKVTIYQGVTLGAPEVDVGYAATSRPTIGDGVIIGSGAKVLGGITLGCGARVGANAVVLKSVPPGALAVGVPARVVAPVGDVTNVVT